MNRRVIGTFIAVLGFAVLTLMVLSIVSNAIFLNKATTAQGIVVSTVRVETKNPDHPAYYPIIQFTTSRGETVEFQSQFSIEGRPQSIGDTVSVLYDSNHPKDAEVNPGSSVWIQFGWLCVGGAFILAISLLAIRSALT